MEKKRSSTNADTLRAKIIGRFMDNYLTEGRFPGSVHQFCSEVGIKEQDFYQHFGSFRGVQKAIWEDLIMETIQLLDADKKYATFGVREKLLSFYYTHLEVLTRTRSFILLCFEKRHRKLSEPQFLGLYKRRFIDYIKLLIAEGLETGEMANRKYLSDHYHHGFWVQLLFILKFWIEDDSVGFEKTDAAVEKAVTLSFDLIRTGPLESMFDLAKFVVQNR